MVFEESNEGAERIVHDLLRRGRPDRRRLRQQVVVDKGAAVVAILEIVAQPIICPGACHQILWRFAIKAHDIEQQGNKARAKQIEALGEQAVQTQTAIFQRAFVDRNAERHVRQLMGNAQMIEQFQQVRIARLIEDDEAHVDPQRLGLRADIDRMAVAPDLIFRLEDGDVVMRIEVPGRRQAGNTGADDGDAAARSGLSKGQSVVHVSVPGPRVMNCSVYALPSRPDH